MICSDATQAGSPVRRSANDFCTGTFYFSFIFRMVYTFTSTLHTVVDLFRDRSTATGTHSIDTEFYTHTHTEELKEKEVIAFCVVRALWHLFEQ